MRAVAMLVMHQLSSHGIDPAIVDVFWMLAGSIGAVMLISVAWRVLRLALFFIAWGIVVFLGLLIVAHLAVELL